MASPLQLQRLRRARERRAEERAQLARAARASFAETIDPNIVERAALFLNLADVLADDRSITAPRRKS